MWLRRTSCAFPYQKAHARLCPVLRGRKSGFAWPGFGNQASLRQVLFWWLPPGRRLFSDSSPWPNACVALRRWHDALWRSVSGAASSSPELRRKAWLRFFRRARCRSPGEWRAPGEASRALHRWRSIYGRSILFLSRVEDSNIHELLLQRITGWDFPLVDCNNARL
jgi:hypothetical protein